MDGPSESSVPPPDPQESSLSSGDQRNPSIRGASNSEQSTGDKSIPDSSQASPQCEEKLGGDDGDIPADVSSSDYSDDEEDLAPQEELLDSQGTRERLFRIEEQRVEYETGRNVKLEGIRVALNNINTAVVEMKRLMEQFMDRKK